MAITEDINQIAVKRSMFLGDSRTFQLTVKRRNPVDNTLTIEDLTGASLAFTLKESLESTTSVFAKTTSSIDEVEIVDAVNGRADIKLQPSDTVSLAPGEYVFDVELTALDGKVHTVARGSLLLRRGVT